MSHFSRQSLRHSKLAAVAALALLSAPLLTACGSSAADEVPETVTSTVTTTSATTKTTTATTTVTETVTEEPVPAEEVDVSGAGVDATVDDNPPVIAGFAAVPEPAPEPAPAPAPQQSTYYSNCSAARAAGAAPVYLGDPGYGSHLDRDGDGVGCE